MLRSLLCLSALLLAGAANGRAQSFTACEGGAAGDFPCQRIDLGASLGLDTFEAGQGNDIWGWTDPATSREYALVGLDNGTAFVDVTVPTAPVYLGKLPTATSASTWRDIKVYADHAFIVSEAPEHGMQVFDLTRLRSVASPPAVFTADARYDQTGKVHNIAIDTESGFAYLLGANGPDVPCNGGGLHIVDIRTPLSPTLAGCFDDDGYTHDAQCMVYRGPDADYTDRQICAAFQGRTSEGGDNHISIVDVTDKANPVLISELRYPTPAYTHQGWFTEDFRYLLVDDELDEQNGLTFNTRTMVFDMQDLDDPEFWQFFFGLSGAIDHNLYVRGRYAFQSNYEAGLRVIDLSGIGDGVITEVASFDTYPNSDNAVFNGQWSNYPYFPSGTIIANDQNNGLFILAAQFPIATDADTSGPETPGESGYALTPATPNPFRSRTSFRLAVRDNQIVRAELFDLAGRHVATVHEGPARVGTPLTIHVEADDLPSGLYLVRVTGERFMTTRRISLLR